MTTTETQRSRKLFQMLDLHNINYEHLKATVRIRELEIVEKFRELGIRVVERKTGCYECFTSNIKNTKRLKGRDWKLKLLRLELQCLSMFDGVSVEHIANSKKFYFGSGFNLYTLVASNCLGYHPKDVRKDQRSFFKMILFGHTYSMHSHSVKKISEVTQNAGQ